MQHLSKELQFGRSTPPKNMILKNCRFAYTISLLYYFIIINGKRRSSANDAIKMHIMIREPGESAAEV